jgi:hypothetical protein
MQKSGLREKGKNVVKPKTTINNPCDHKFPRFFKIESNNEKAGNDV